MFVICLQRKLQFSGKNLTNMKENDTESEIIIKMIDFASGNYIILTKNRI